MDPSTSRILFGSVVKFDGPSVLSTSLRIVSRYDRDAESPRYTSKFSISEWKTQDKWIDVSYVIDHVHLEVDGTTP